MPRATMRLQFHEGFSFAHAERLVPYLARLGISHIYASPITTARPGSLHGYDVIDPTQINPELGGEEGLGRLVSALRGAGLGLIADIVPNHMAVGADNAWWFDVLKHGPESRYASYFDIDWNAEDETLRRKVLLPFLGKPYREVLDAGEITLAPGPSGYTARYFDQRYPIADPECEIARLSVAAFDPTSAGGRERLDALLSRQHYRLAWWRVANDEINWRRFFDINELAALRMEHAPAFEDVHALIFRLYAQGLVDGVRIDHVDGLSDPASYCRRLRERLDALTERRPAPAPRGRAYIVVEKILLRGETLPATWRCDGTSGYDFMNDVSAVQHDARGEAPLGRLWQSLSARSADFRVEEQAARREIIARSFTAQLEACVAAFHRLARAEPDAEITRAALRRALIEVLAHFPVYRTYATARERPANDRYLLSAAVAGARTTSLSIDRGVIDRLEVWLAERSGNPDVAAIQDPAVTKFQQLSAPIAAKAVEDTAFYRYGRLLSRNDVGFEASRFNDDATDFHANALRRQATFPNALLATATHDHKRGEDVRARLAVLSERAEEWASVVPEWIERCRPVRRAADGALLPHPADIAILFQTIVGAWPLDLDIRDSEGRSAFAGRLALWQQKALREAKLATDWVLPNAAYESAAREFLMSLVARNEVPVLGEIAAFAERIAPAGAVNGLAQTLLKLTAPGIPDIYQGTEFWDFSLVDPDNRRPVDFAARAAGLDSSKLETLAENWRDGRLKQALIAKTLALRHACPKLFSVGRYEPIEVRGAFTDRIVAFARSAGGNVAITVVPRVASGLLRNGCIMFEPTAWKDTALAPLGVRIVNAFDRQPVGQDDAPIRIGELFRRLPFALLVSADCAEHL